MIEKIDKIRGLLIVPSVDEHPKMAINQMQILNILVELRAEAEQLTIPDVSGRSEQYCQCVSRVGINGEQYGKWTCKSCGKEVPNKHRQY